MKRIVFIGAILILLLGGLLTVRFLFGGNEDAWICAGGQWAKHGNPRSPMPTKTCSK